MNASTTNDNASRRGLQASLLDAEGAEIGFEHGDIVVDARTIADGLGLDPSQVPDLMRSAKITSLHEMGLDADAGRHRVTFFHAERSFRLIVEASGKIGGRSSSAERPLA